MRASTSFSLAVAAIGSVAHAQLRPSPTLPQHRFGQIFPRQTDLGGIGDFSPACTSALLSLPPPPTPPPKVQSYILSEGITSLDPCGLSGIPSSLKSDFSTYQSEASSWYDANKGKLTDCSQLLDLQKAYSTSCPSQSKGPTTITGTASDSTASSATNDQVTTISGTRTGSGSSPTNTGDSDGSNGGSSDGDSSGSSTGSGSKSLSGGAIAGIVIGAVAAVGILAAIIIFFIWRSRRKSKMNANQQQQQMQQQMPMQPGMVNPNDKPVYQYQYPPNNNYVYEMPGQQQHPVELGHNSEPVYEMPTAHMRPG